MANRKTLLTISILALLAAMISSSAQEETPVAEESVNTEQADLQEPVVEAAAPAEENPEQPPAVEPSETGEPGLNSFTPSEEISSDRSVAFPNDI